MTKYEVPDDHWEEEQEDEEESNESPVRVESHDVDVILTVDPDHDHADMGYGREKYTVRLVDDDEDAPYALYCIEHKWKGNYWRDVKELDWRDIPTEVQLRVAEVVDCAGVDDLDSGVRLVEEGGRSTWTARKESDDSEQ